MSQPIIHDRPAHRFRLVVDGHECVLVYRLAEGVMTIVHTGVPPEVGGRGLGGQLVRQAFETARAEGWKVVPACEFAAAFIQRHPEYGDLVA